MNKKQLWLNLKAYHFDDLVPPQLWHHIQENFGGPNASTKAFASKIARKLKWPEKFALRAIAEYKKFVYLGIVGDFVVTPSKIIDQVWHEHLLFNKAYRLFCAEVIQYEFDHTPELIPLEDQTGTFNAQFSQTIQLYTIEFGMPPPFDIWGSPKFDINTQVVNGYESKKKKSDSHIEGGGPLFTYFDPSSDSNHPENFPEFAGFGEGDSGGGGATGRWSEPNATQSDSSDAGSNCSSGCSSGCGGGD